VIPGGSLLNNLTQPEVTPEKKAQTHSLAFGNGLPYRTGTQPLRVAQVYTGLMPFLLACQYSVRALNGTEQKFS